MLSNTLYIWDNLADISMCTYERKFSIWAMYSLGGHACSVKFIGSILKQSALDRSVHVLLVQGVKKYFSECIGIKGYR